MHTGRLGMRAAPEAADDDREALADAMSARCMPATVVALFGAGRVRVRDRRGTFDAQVALSSYDPREGDVVLALGADDGATYVIGVLNAPRSLLDEVLSGEASGDEAEASGNEASGTEPVKVHDKRGRLIFEYDAESDRAVLHAVNGDLHIAVPEGELSIETRDGVRIASESTVSVKAARSIELDVEAGAAPTARVSLTPGRVSFVSAALEAAAERAELVAVRLGVRSREVETRFDRVRNVVDVLETHATRIVERAVDVYRETEGLSQTRAGRLRLVAQKAVQIVGENALVKARDRMKIKGERIHLA
ncbi:MAG: DUF3540 domain-containing protein [Sandaracinaceae bacterium]|nr:DUF3540 domain-containing protein [Sandaracinaceae bacterium]